MSLLDRLKPQPRWKHPDPETRIAAILELDDADELRAIVRDDADAGVRRAAVKRLGDVDFLAAVARDDADERVRTEAAASLVEIATTGEAAAAEAAASALGDQKYLATIARSSPHETARHAAVTRLSDPRALGSVARQAVDLTTAMRALEQLTHREELVDVAINSEHKDVAVAALETCAAADAGARDTFQTIATRAKHKAVGRRALALVQAIDEAEAARLAAIEARRRQQVALCETVEAAERMPDWQAADAALASAEQEWRSLEPDVDPELARRLAEAAVRTRQAIEARRTEAAEAERKAAAREAERASRVALVERVAALDASSAEVLDRAASLEQDWAQLAPPVELAANDAARLSTEFAAALTAVREGRQRWEAAEAARAGLTAVADEADTLSAAEDMEAIARHWPDLAARWQALAAEAGVVDEATASRFREARSRVESRVASLRQQAEQARADNLARLVQLCQHLEARVGTEDVKLRELERGQRSLRAALETPPPLPDTREATQIVDRLKAVQARLVPRLRELRELDDWKRFANASAQEELIAQVEALRAEPDLEKAANTLRDLHTRWRDVAEAPRDQAEALWRRFKSTSDEIRVRCGEFFAKQAEERAANLKLKEALCERAEALASSTDWIKTAEELKRLQAEWKTIGPVSRKHAKSVWKRFRAACDAFFTRRHADLAERKQMWAANLERKQTLCAQAEALAESNDWETAAAEVRRLQAEWKTVGPVRKNKSEAIWLRFRTACDHFFDRYKHRHQIELGSKLSEREALVVDLESLTAVDRSAGPPDDLAARLAANWTQWTRLPALPREVLEPLVQRYSAAQRVLVETFPAVFAGTPLDPSANLKKMEALCVRVENCLMREPEPTAAATPTAILAARLREALAANTIGGRPNSRQAEESKWRAAVDDVKDAQAAWRRLGPVPGDAGRALADRFQHACNRFFDQHRRRQAPQPPSARPPRAGR
jgi:hypothetical protein